MIKIVIITLMVIIVIIIECNLKLITIYIIIAFIMNTINTKTLTWVCLTRLCFIMTCNYNAKLYFI